MSRANKDWNPFYFLLVLVGILFVMTALGYVTSMIRMQSRLSDRSRTGPQSPAMRFLAQYGESVLLGEAAALGGLAILAMSLDRWRSRQPTKSETHQPADRRPDLPPRSADQP